MQTRNRTSRLALLALTTSMLLGGLSGRAVAGPEDEVRDLLVRVENVVATGISPDTIIVAWRPPLLGEYNVHSYRVEMSNDEEGPFNGVNSNVSCNPLACVTQIGAGPRSDPTPKWIRVVPILTAKVPKTPLNVQTTGVPLLEGRPSIPDPAILASDPPTNLRCNGQLACTNVTSIELTWQDNSDEQQFWIFRTGVGGAQPAWSPDPHAKVSANETRYLESGLDLERQYYYKVVAVRQKTILRSNGLDTVEEKAFSDAAGPDKVRVETPKIPAPLDPTGLTTLFQAPNKAQLTWTDNATDEDGYFVEWGPSCSKFEYMTALPPRSGTGATTWTDPSVPADSRRCYQVRAYRFGPAYSRFTNRADIGSTPLAPGNLQVTSFTNAVVNLLWQDRSNSETHFTVERCPGTCTASSPGWLEVGTSPENVGLFADTEVDSNTVYSWRVFAANSSGKSPSSNIVTLKTAPSPIPAPSDLTAVGISSYAIQLQWKDNSVNETGFRIEFQNYDGDWETLVVVNSKPGSGSTVTAIDTESLSVNTRRCYRVRAIRPGEVSDASNESCGRTLGPQPPNGAPGAPVATAVNSTTIDLEWQDNSTNEESFRIYVRSYIDELCGAQNPEGQFTQLTTAPAGSGTNTVKHRLTGLTPHTAYFFKVVAVNRDGVAPAAANGSVDLGAAPTGACAATYGPPRPIFVDPATNADFEVTRCHVTVRANPSKVDRMRLYVVSNLPGAGPYRVDELFLNAPTSGDQWRFEYKFRQGTHYGLLATSYGDWVDKTLRYPSIEMRLRDITVAADCPVDPDPIDPEPVP